ncbi:MAG: hypothetical protein Q8O67_29340 [Deltaproteobacteria bacterium]|nr:hypothetical protein [Deltaproteobacteria bacterium]
MSDNTNTTWKRRHFLAAGAAAALLPAFLQRAFACPPPPMPIEPGCAPLPAGVDDVSAAFRKAVAIGKPLLVILIPDDPGEKYARGELWGELLNHGSTSSWAALACVEVVCATSAALHALVPGAVTGDALFVLVETDVMPAVATSATATIPSYGEGRRGGGDESWEEQQKNERKIGERRIAILGTLVEQTVFGTPPGNVDVPSPLGRRVAQTNAALKAAGNLEKFDPDARASLLVQAGDLERAQAAAVARLKVARVRGSKWATGGGCGVTVEGERDDVGIACGMGHTPALSRRFLYWFTK